MEYESRSRPVGSIPSICPPSGGRDARQRTFWRSQKMRRDTKAALPPEYSRNVLEVNLRKKALQIGHLMPVSDLPVSAGTGAFLDEGNFEMVSFPESSIPDGAEFGVRVSGDSMEPVYHDGQIVWVQQCETLRTGEVGVMIYDGQGYIKAYAEQEPDDPEAYLDSDGVRRMQPVMVSYSKAYEAETINVIRGKSRLNVDLLNSLVAKCKEEIAELSQEVEMQKAEMEHQLESAAQEQAEFEKLESWADLYDNCTFEAKKMIVSQLTILSTLMLPARSRQNRRMRRAWNLRGGCWVTNMKRLYVLMSTESICTVISCSTPFRL